MEKKLLLAILIVSSIVSNLFGISHTFFSPRQVTTDPIFELGLTDFNIYHPQDGNKFQFYFKPFYQVSTNTQKLGQFFSPGNKQCLSVREDGLGDVNPLWFNVISPSGSFYTSTISLRPQRQVYGAVLTFYANLDCFCNRFWLLMNTALMGSSNRIAINEARTSPAGTIPGFATMAQGLNNPAFCAERISCNYVSKGGLDDIQVKLGYNAYLCDNESGHIAPYFVFTIPTGARPKSRYLFEPLVGTNHWSAGVGLNTEYMYNICDDHNVSLLGDLKYRYVFTATERRAFDLITGGEWSRYLLAVTQAQPLNTLPGNNFFTQDVKITPQSTIDLWLAAHYSYCNWDLEFGYSFWWRQCEKLALCCPTNLGVGIFDMGAICSQIITSANGATIANSIANGTVPNNGLFGTLSTANFNLNSAIQPSTLSNKIYLAGAWHDNSLCHNHPLLVGIGTSYEFGNKCSSLSQWALWLNVGVDF